jgi:hypothetical protein
VQHLNEPIVLHASTYRGGVYEAARDYIVKPLLANLEPDEHGLPDFVPFH